MCTVELPFTLILDNVMRSRARHHNRRPAVPRADSVRRTLFSEPVDHEATARLLSREFADLQRDARARWNYDFQNDRPLRGRYEWYPVKDVEATASTSVPEADPKPSSSDPTKRPVQTKLTDFMAKRKRPSNTSVKLSGPPNKSRRISPPSTSPSRAASTS